MQNIFAPDLFQRRRNPKLKEHDAYILQNRGICPAILAADLDVTERFVVSRQRKLGVRPPKSNFRFTPESGLRSDIAPCPKSAMSGSERIHSIISSARARRVGGNSS